MKSTPALVQRLYSFAKHWAPGWRRMLAVVVLLSSCAVTKPAWASSVDVVATNFADAVLAPDAPLQFDVNKLPLAAQGELRLILGKTDVSGMLRVETLGEQSARVIFTPGLIVLPEGASSAALYLVDVAGKWQPIGSWTVRVASPSGFTESEFSPSLVIGVEGQLDEGHSGDAQAPKPRTYQDGSLQAGLQSYHKRDDLELRSSWNFTGATRNEKTLRFSEKEDAAYNIDLVDFLLELEKGNTHVSAGHVSYGNNPLLLDSFATRGVALRHQLTSRWDVSVSSMNATSIVGFNNFSGLGSSHHRVNAAGIGFEVLPSRPGALRAELTYMDASQKSDLNFDVGEVADAEASEGWGLRVLGETASGRLRADLSLASSRFFNPADPFLDFGDDVVETQATRDTARHVEVTYALLQNGQLGSGFASSLTLSYVHDRADPLYRSLGAYVQADRLSDQLSLSGHVGHINMAANYIRSEDNLDDVPTILKTKTRNTAVSLNTSLQQLLGVDESRSVFWPSLNYSYNRAHQFAANNPEEDDSGFNGGSHLPDQMNTSHEVGINWSGNVWSTGLRAALSDQDNRQIGREASDFELVDYSANVGWRATDSLNLGFNWTTGTNEDKEAQIKRRTQSYGVNIDWQISPDWSFSGNYDTGKDNDSAGQAISKNNSASAQVSWSFALKAFGRELPGQLFLRYSEQENESRDNLFDFESDAQTWFVNSGFSLTLF